MWSRMACLKGLINRWRHSCMAVMAQWNVHVKGFSLSSLTEKMSTHHTHLDCTRSTPCYGTTNPLMIPSISKQNHVKNGHLRQGRHVKNVRNSPQALLIPALSTKSKMGPMRMPLLCIMELGGLWQSFGRKQIWWLSYVCQNWITAESYLQRLACLRITSS